MQMPINPFEIYAPQEASPFLPGFHPFPKAWLWFIDEWIPHWVKKNYSQKEIWKNKPFSQTDAAFFSRGVKELSTLFTQERSRALASYFQHAKYRSSYLLYFMPLQMAKFLTLFQIHSQAIDACLHHGSQQRTLRIADLGSGPGTASLSFLLLLLEKNLSEIPPIEFFWFDLNTTIMQDGKKLAEALASQFPKLRGKVKIYTQPGPWWEATQTLKPTSLIFLGNVLNESGLPRNTSFWTPLLDQAQGGGMLFLEPAHKSPSQYLSSLRDKLLENHELPIWGPCLHTSVCPLQGGRNWCHFSYPIRIPGNWFQWFSKDLASERKWLKFSYLWLASCAYPPKAWNPKVKRVISDILEEHNPNVLLCNPDHPERLFLDPKTTIHRGELIKMIPASKKITKIIPLC